MTSRPPTAIEEIQGRIEDLDRHADERHSAKTCRDAADGYDATAEQYTTLRDGYIELLATVSRTGSIVVDVSGAISDPKLVAEIVAMHGRLGRLS